MNTHSPKKSWNENTNKMSWIWPADSGSWTGWTDWERKSPAGERDRKNGWQSFSSCRKLVIMAIWWTFYLSGVSDERIWYLYNTGGTGSWTSWRILKSIFPLAKSSCVTSKRCWRAWKLPSSGPKKSAGHLFSSSTVHLIRHKMSFH